PRTRGRDVDLDLSRALDDADLGQAGMRELVLDVPANRQVLVQVVRKVALVEPVRLPVVDVADPETLWMDLLSHSSVLRSQRPGDVAGSLVDPSRAAQCPRPVPAQGGALIDVDVLDSQVVGNQVMVRLGVRRR